MSSKATIIRPAPAAPAADTDAQAKARENAAKLIETILPAGELTRMDIPERPAVLGRWMREGDLGYLFAPRGHGKTWLALLVANAISYGTSLGQWTEGTRARNVIYLDAEMNLADTKERAAKLDMEVVCFLHNEPIFEKLGRALNIANPTDQEALNLVLQDGDVFVIDNLSTAGAGMSENDNDDFDMVRDWLIRLRHRKITVIVVHHAGRNGEMRGASRREDMAHWILSLKDDTDDGQSVKTFVTTFTKCRNCSVSDAPPLRWSVDLSGEQVAYDCRRHNGIDAMEALIRDGVEQNSELAAELGVSPGNVSKWAKRLEKDGRISIDGRKYKAA